MISHNPHASRRILPLALAVLLTAQTLPATAATPDTYIGPDQGLWSDPTNWTAGTPNSASFDVFLTDSAGLTTLLDTTENINNLSITSPNTLTLEPATALTLHGTSLTNAGTILLNASSSLLTFATGSLALSGQGTVELLSPNSRINASLSSDNFIFGQGTITGPTLENSGTITATTGTLSLLPSNAGTSNINTGELLASGGVLRLVASGTVNNSGGLILAANSSSAMIFTSIAGGTIGAQIGGTITLFGASNALLQTPDNAGTIVLGGPVSPQNILSNSTIAGYVQTSTLPEQLQGIITNNGVFHVFSGGGLSLVGPGALAGSGTLLLSNAGLTQATGAYVNSSLVSGQGTLQFSNFTNQGVMSTAPGSALTLQPYASTAPFSNTGTLSTGGGALDFDSAFTLTNTGGIIDAGTGIIRQLGTIQGGTLTGSGGSITTGLNSLIQGSSTQTLSIAGSLSIIEPSPNYLWLSPGVEIAGSVILQGNANSEGLTVDGSLIFAQSVSSPSIEINLFGDATHPSAITNNGTIGGAATITGGYPIVNNGLIVAPAGKTLTLWVSAISNDGILRADGGTLVIQPAATPYFPLGGTIDAINNGVVKLQGLLDGATLTSSSGGSIQAATQLQFAGNNTINALLSLGTATATYADGTSLSGSGTLLLGTHFGPASATASFLNAMIIAGQGVLPFAGVNSGTITPFSPAGFTPGYLDVIATTSGLTNTGVLLATSGTLVLTGSFNNTGALIQASNGGAIAISNASISGGSLTSSGVNIPPLYVIGPGAMASVYYSPPALSISNSDVSLDSLSSTAFTTAPTLAFFATTINISNSTVSIAGGLNLLGGANLVFSSGSLTVSGPITLSSADSQSNPLNFADAGIAFNSTIPNSQNVAAVTGDGGISVGTGAALTSDGVTTAGLVLNAGSTLTIRPSGGDSGTSKVSLLTIAGTTNAWTATLDITDNKLIIQTGSAPLLDKTSAIEGLQNQLQSAKNGASGPWTGTGITSSTVAQDAATQTAHSYHTTLALYDNAVLGLTTFGGQTVDANSLLITRALVADANLDNTVDNADLVILLTHFGLSGQTQSGGDYDGNGTVDNADLVALLTNYGQSLPGSFSLQPSPQTASLPPATSVPEPASLWLLAALLPLLAVRKSRIV